MLFTFAISLEQELLKIREHHSEKAIGSAYTGDSFYNADNQLVLKMGEVPGIFMWGVGKDKTNPDFNNHNRIFFHTFPETYENGWDSRDIINNFMNGKNDELAKIDDWEKVRCDVAERSIATIFYYSQSTKIWIGFGLYSANDKCEKAWFESYINDTNRRLCVRAFLKKYQALSNRRDYAELFYNVCVRLHMYMQESLELVYDKLAELQATEAEEFAGEEYYKCDIEINDHMTFEQIFALSQMPHSPWVDDKTMKFVQTIASSTETQETLVGIFTQIVDQFALRPYSAKVAFEDFLKQTDKR